MHTIIDLCFLCTKDYHCVPVDSKIISQVEYILPEITIFKLGIPLRICSVCDGALYAFGKFKQFYMETSQRLETSIKGAGAQGPPLHTDTPFLDPAIQFHRNTTMSQNQLQTSGVHTDTNSNNAEDISIEKKELKHSTQDQDFCNSVEQNTLNTQCSQLDYNINGGSATLYTSDTYVKPEMIEEIFIKEELEEPQDMESYDVFESTMEDDGSNNQTEDNTEEVNATPEISVEMWEGTSAEPEMELLIQPNQTVTEKPSSSKHIQMPARFGSTSSDVINYVIEKSIPRNTKKSQDSAWNQFSKFCREREYKLNNETSNEQISNILKDWGYNMRKENGDNYKEAVVKTMWNIIAKLIQEMYYKKYNRKIDPFKDIIFKAARDARNAKRRQLRTYEIQLFKKKRKTRLTESELEKILNLWDENTPFGLQRKFYHIATHQLVWGASEASACLVQYFKEELNIDGSPTGRVEYTPVLSNSEQGGSQRKSVPKWLTANNINQNNCPVRLLKKLLSKRTDNIKTDRLFITPNKDLKYWYWYKNSPVGRNEIAKWKKEAVEKLQLEWW